MIEGHIPPASLNLFHKYESWLFLSSIVKYNYSNDIVLIYVYLTFNVDHHNIAKQIRRKELIYNYDDFKFKS